MNLLYDDNPMVPRVLQFVPGFLMGGVESLLMEIYRSLDKQQLQFDFMVDSYDKLPEFYEIQAAGGRVFQMGRYVAAPLRYQYKINQILTRYSHEYCALHAHDVLRGLPILWAARRHGIQKRILHAHTDSYEGSHKARIAPLISFVTTPLATEYWACSRAAGLFSFGRRDFKVFNNTIRSRSFVYDEAERKHTRHELGIEEQGMVIGHTGRFTYQKNHSWVIKVFAELRGVKKDSQLLLIGAGPLEGECRALAKNLGVMDGIHLAGHQRKIAPYLSAMDVFFLPSHYEGFGISLLEAQANGVPTLASDVIPEEVQVTPSISTLSLDENESNWRDTLLEMYEQGRLDSINNLQLIRQAGYDTETELSNLVEAYKG